MHSTDKKYLKYISYLQVIGIILVVAGHSVHLYPDGASGVRTLFYRGVYSFHMPLFLFVSGFLMIYTTGIYYKPKHKIKKYITGKIKRLLLPFITLTAVTFFPRAMMSSVADDVIEPDIQSFFMAFIDKEYLVIPFFWYLQACFLLLTVSYCILYFGRKLNISIKVMVPILFLGLLVLYLSPYDVTTLFSLNKIKELGLYFMLGAMYCMFADTIDRFIPWTSVFFALLLAVGWGITFTLFEGTEWVIICTVLGIMMCTSVARIIEERQWHFLDHLVGANYLIFLLSWYLNVTTQQMLSHFIELPWWVHSTLSLFAGIYIPLWAYRYLQCHSESRWIKLTSFLLGQTIKNNSKEQSLKIRNI